MSYKIIDACRLCGSDSLKSFIDFGTLPLGNDLQDDLELSKSTSIFPLEVKNCNCCNHFQLSHSISPELLYATNYTYLSGVGLSFKKHIESYAKWIKSKCSLHSENFVVDIGSNDGTTLQAFKKIGFKVLGVDPAHLPSKLANERGIETINSFFDQNVVKTIIKNKGQPDLITSQNVLAHVDDIRGIFKNIFSLLKNNGFFCFEVGYFGDVLKKGFFDTIYHEHLDYHHASPLVEMLKKTGFEILHLSLNKVQGGSLRVLAKKSLKNSISIQAQNFVNNEKLSVLYNDKFQKNWPSLIKNNLSNLKKQVEHYKSKGKTIIAYGAPTKIVLLLKMSKLSASNINFIVEDNRHKIGKFIPKFGIEIKEVSNLNLFENKVVIIMAWNFSDDIINKLEKASIKPFTVIVPLPTLKKHEILKKSCL